MCFCRGSLYCGWVSSRSDRSLAAMAGPASAASEYACGPGLGVGLGGADAGFKCLPKKERFFLGGGAGGWRLLLQSADERTTEGPLLSARAEPAARDRDEDDLGDDLGERSARPAGSGRGDGGGRSEVGASSPGCASLSAWLSVLSASGWPLEDAATTHRHGDVYRGAVIFLQRALKNKNQGDTISNLFGSRTNN